MKDTEKTRTWLLRLSKMNGTSVASIAGLFTVGALIWWDPIGLIVGLGVTSAGLMELLGRHYLKSRHPDARRWLPLSQLWLLVCVLAYAAFRLLDFNWQEPLRSLSGEEAMQLMILTGFHGESLGQVIALMYGLVYVLVAALTLIFQGGLCIYYWRRLGEINEPDP